MISTPVYVRQLGLVPYERSLREMQSFNDSRTADTPDELWVLEHMPVFTLGINGAEDDIFDARDTPVIRADRGGQVTWHGPGQLVVYTLLNLARKKLGVRDLVCSLERSIILALQGYGIDANGREGAPGVYVGDEKIASIGLRVRRQCCYHGISINVNADLNAFSQINPCGYEGLAVTRTCDRGGAQTVAQLTEDLLPLLLDELNLEQLAS